MYNVVIARFTTAPCITQVPLGVIFKNENVTDEMIDILLQIHKYVPSQSKQGIDEVTGDTFCDDKVHRLLFGGDQLTRKRAEGANDLRANSKTLLTALKGLIPVGEDWHTKKILLEVCIYIAHSK